MDYQAENVRLRKLCRAYAAGEVSETEYRNERRLLIESVQQGVVAPVMVDVPDLGLVESTLPNLTGTMPVLDDASIAAGRDEATVFQAALPASVQSAGVFGSFNPWLIGGLFGLLGVALLALVIVAIL